MPATSRPVVKAKPQAPVPPAKRPAAKRPIATPRDSAVSMGLNGDSGRGTPDSQRSSNPAAAGLAEALRARQASMRGKEEDDDW